MQVNNAEFMCSSAPPDSYHFCGEECQRDPQDQVLESSKGLTVSVGRFCFYSCEPGSKPKVGDQCAGLSAKEEEAASTSGGNAQDPAELKSKPDKMPDLLDEDPEKAAKAALEPIPE